jgi:membrane-associated phospholipid phosphatase
LFAAFAILAAMQRIESQSHFFSDILAGAAVGAVVAGICTMPRLLGGWFARWETLPRGGE